MKADSDHLFLFFFSLLFRIVSHYRHRPLLLLLLLLLLMLFCLFVVVWLVGFAVVVCIDTMLSVCQASTMVTIIAVLESVYFSPFFSPHPLHLWSSPHPTPHHFHPPPSTTPLPYPDAPNAPFSFFNIVDTHTYIYMPQGMSHSLHISVYTNL